MAGTILQKLGQKDIGRSACDIKVNRPENAKDAYFRSEVKDIFNCEGVKVPREVEGYESVSDYYYGMLLAMKNGGDLSFV